MKKILAFITISFVISCVCWTKPDDKEMVIIKESYDYGSNHAIELFVKYENNISAYSFIFSKEANEISLYIDRNTSFKRYNMYSTPKDTSCYSKVVSQRKYTLCDYKSFLRQLNLCLNKAQDYYNLKCLKSIYFQTSDLQERTKEFTTFLYKEKIYKNNMWYTDEQIISALNKTSFRNDLNNMLRKYGIKCNCFNCDGLALVQTRKDILQEYLYEPNINILVIVPIVAHISSIK